MKRILIVDDEPNLIKGFASIWSSRTAIRWTKPGREQALNMFAAGKHDLILLDLMLPKIDGMGMPAHPQRLHVPSSC